MFLQQQSISPFGKQIKLRPVYILSPLVTIFNPLPVNISIILQVAFVNPHAVNISLPHSSHDSLLVGKHKQHFAVAIYSNCNVNMVTFSVQTYYYVSVGAIPIACVL